MKKILKYCFISIGILFLTLLILPFTLYIPAIQSWAKDLATTYASKQLNMSIAIERIRLKFPLNLVLDNSKIITAEGDTMLYCDNLQLDVNFRYLLQKKVQIEKFSFQNTHFHYNDTISQLNLKGDVGLLALNAKPVDLGNPEYRTSKRNCIIRLGRKRTRYDKQQIKSHSMDTRYKAIAIREHCFRYDYITPNKRFAS